MISSLRTRLARLEQAGSEPPAEIESEVEFLLMLDHRFGRHRGGIGDTEAEREIMRAMREATDFEGRKAALLAWRELQKLKPTYGMSPAEILDRRRWRAPAA
jgi:hypothetical protein